jgi:hypothetical protein
VLFALALFWLPGPPVMPAVTPSSTSSVSASAVTATIGQARCPWRYAEVTVHNGDTGQGRSYTLYTGGLFLRTEIIPPGAEVHNEVSLARGVPTAIKVVAANRTVAAATRTAGCGPAAAPAPGTGRPRKLPLTGSRAAGTALGATGLATVVAGALLLFYAFLWPRSGCGDWASPVRRTR